MEIQVPRPRGLDADHRSQTAASQRPGENLLRVANQIQAKERHKEKEGRNPKQGQREDRKNREGIKLVLESSGQGRFNSYLLGWPKSSLRFLHVMEKTPNELSG